MKKSLILLMVGCLLLAGCSTSNETVPDATVTSSETSISQVDSEIITADYIDTSKAVITPQKDIKECWGNEEIVPFRFNDKIVVLFPASWDDYDNNHYSFEVLDVMNKDYIKEFIDEYKQYYEDTPDSPLFEDTLIEYADDSLLGIIIGGVGEFWSFYTDSENDKYFSSDKYYKIGTNNGKSYYIFIHPFSDFLYGHGYSHPAYEAFEKEFYDKICKTAYVKEIRLY